MASRLKFIHRVSRVFGVFFFFFFLKGFSLCFAELLVIYFGHCGWTKVKIE